jgi:hypothetical protein
VAHHAVSGHTWGDMPGVPQWGAGSSRKQAVVGDMALGLREWRWAGGPVKRSGGLAV